MKNNAVTKNDAAIPTPRHRVRPAPQEGPLAPMSPEAFAAAITSGQLRPRANARQLAAHGESLDRRVITECARIATRLAEKRDLAGAELALDHAWFWVQAHMDERRPEHWALLVAIGEALNTFHTFHGGHHGVEGIGLKHALRADRFLGYEPPRPAPSGPFADDEEWLWFDDEEYGDPELIAAHDAEMAA